MQNMMGLDKKQFHSNLQLTQAYCEQQIQRCVGENNAVILRSINPIYNEAQIFIFKANEYVTESDKDGRLIVDWNDSADPYESEFFTWLFGEQLALKQVATAPADGTEFRGRILVVEYDCNIPDGAAAIESSGFVDTLDFPPIDTWFYKCKSDNGRINAAGWLLFAWIPQQFVILADEAIATQFLDILHWFEDWLPSEYRRVIEHL